MDGAQANLAGPGFRVTCVDVSNERYNPDGTPDWASTEKLFSSYDESGSDGTTVRGITGEAPEVDPDKVHFTQGMDITVVTSTRNDDEARELLKQFGMPFRD